MSERNGVPVSASRRRAGSKASRTASPQRERVARVVHLVEDHQGVEPLGADPVRQRVGGHSGVGQRDADEVAAAAARAPGVRRVERDADLRGSLGPLGLEVLGRRDHGDPVDHPAREQLGGDRERERRLARARASPPPGSRAGSLLKYAVQRRRLPRAQARRRAPGGAVGIGRWEVELDGASQSASRAAVCPSAKRHMPPFHEGRVHPLHLTGGEQVHAGVVGVVHEVAHRVASRAPCRCPASSRSRSWARPRPGCRRPGRPGRRSLPGRCGTARASGRSRGSPCRRGCSRARDRRAGRPR